jgi:hypothetical protein
MQANRFSSGDKGTKMVAKDLLEFTGERLPEYRWLQKVCLTEESPAPGGGKHREPGWEST